MINGLILLAGFIFLIFISQYADLMKKRKVVLNDKAKIASVIEELDKKKKEALLKAWEQVNKVKKIVKNTPEIIPHIFSLTRGILTSFRFGGAPILVNF